MSKQIITASFSDNIVTTHKFSFTTHLKTSMFGNSKSHIDLQSWTESIIAVYFTEQLS